MAVIANLNLRGYNDHLMDRRKFALTMAAMAAPVEAAANISGYRTFNIAGKEERPFQGRKEATLASHEGKGYLAHMWFGGSFPDYARIRLRVYVDHEPTAAISMELGMGTGFGFQDPDAPWGNNAAGKTGSPSGIFNFYRIPFSTSVRVTAELPAGVADDQVFWWIVRGIEGLPLEVSGLHLPDTARLKLYTRENFTAQPLEEFDLCRTERAGMVYQIAMAAKSESFAFLEAIMRAYVDQAKEAQFLSSGLEDYFLGTYYFNRGLYHLRQAGLTHKDDQNHTFSAYRFHEQDPIFFSRGLRLACRCGEKMGDKVFGAAGELRATTYTTYAWLYEW